MNWKFWKKQEKETIQQERNTPKYYYPKMLIEFIKYITRDGSESVEVLKVNYCCETIKKYSDIDNYKVYEYFYFSRLGRFLTNPSNPHNRDKVNYCPFCGAKIELTCIKTLKMVKTGCDEVTKPLEIIPAKTKKVCKYDWREVES
ncbi:hypothetical protein SDC9_07457 [bioreactor metagenome]|uniref:Uncharacterized protein n=1 Tax=bioreactor metagenome TaxID=1076179 RepID=A0A644T4K9_9ZZZZ|nr:hypothetical protein [Methanobrevibacter sp.]MEA4956913.1 hypothetical protein [Methanobrevibacter sp.]